MKKAQYLFRLDDACPYQKRQRWEQVISLFLSYSIKPLIAIIPDCQDPKLCNFPYQNDFWEKARSWQKMAYPLALHGYQHRLHKVKKNLIPINRYSEFTELPFAEQFRKIKKAWQLITQQRLWPSCWVAPAHGFDTVTLQVLKEITPIRIISDGFALGPFRWQGFLWIPQQLWKARTMPIGIYTVCLHPNEMEEHDIVSLYEFLKKHYRDCPSWDDVIHQKHTKSGLRLLEHSLLKYVKIIKDRFYNK